jgi:arylsulfatase A-like enzyme
MGGIICMFSLLGSGSASAGEEKRQLWNVVLFVIDDLGQRDLGCYGSTFYRTPHIDRLAREGVRLTDFYAVCPVCSPTRVSILTGQYPQRWNITDWIPGRGDRPDQRLQSPSIRTALPLEATTLAEVLQRRGYVTAHIGKWHLGGKGFGPKDQGFDINIGGDETGTPRSYFAPFRNKGGVMPGLEEAPEGEYLTDRLAREAVRFIAAHKDKPFFLYLPHFAVHTPLRAPAERIRRYPNAPRAGTQSNPVYAAMVESMDEAVGQVLQALVDHRLLDKTVVLFTSDNGGLATREGGPTGATFNGPLRAGKGFLYEGGVRVPLIIRWPGHGQPGVTCEQVACTNDLFDTILDAAGGRQPVDPTTDGRSLLPLVEGKTLPERPVYWHYPHYANQGSRPGGAMRRGRYKLVEDYETGRHELYDLSRDLAEQTNLAGEQPELVRQLANELEQWRRQVGARLPHPNPQYRPHPPDASGTITLPARTALIRGQQWRFEPLPHQESIGQWIQAGDSASWDFTVTQPGRFRLELNYSCDPQAKDAVVELSLGSRKQQHKLEATTSIHDFQSRPVGLWTLDQTGRYTLTLRLERPPSRPLVELRSIVLRPVKNEDK